MSMTAQELNALLQLEKGIHQKLVEAIELTRDLAESVERQDQVSLQLFLSMRQRVLLEWQELHSNLDLMQMELSPMAAEQLQALHGGGQAQGPEEFPVADCIATNRRLLKQLAELDERVSRKLCGGKSFYS